MEEKKKQREEMRRRDYDRVELKEWKNYCNMCCMACDKIRKCPKNCYHQHAHCGFCKHINCEVYDGKKE